MRCPVDNETLVMADRNGVEIDYCPKCRGVWLDRGELDLAIAKAGGKPVMLDFYADWCVSCIEMEKLTFADPQVHAAMKQMLLLQADVTANDANDKALLKRFGLYGPRAPMLAGRIDT